MRRKIGRVERDRTLSEGGRPWGPEQASPADAMTRGEEEGERERGGTRTPNGEPARVIDARCRDISLAFINVPRFYLTVTDRARDCLAI